MNLDKIQDIQGYGTEEIEIEYSNKHRQKNTKTFGETFKNKMMILIAHILQQDSIKSRKLVETLKNLQMISATSDIKTGQQIFLRPRLYMEKFSPTNSYINYIQENFHKVYTKQNLYTGDYTNGEKLLKEIIEENSINQNTKNKESRKLDKEDFIDEILTSTETLADKQTKNAIETQSNVMIKEDTI
ncbi:hypothetical protein C2G38_2210772 [Gigaspora rosea]|uniref:Uncharacterized protein n=1 Tax=Gigaspora rosea TaxID=44941 RepID=A0A397UJ03_9GLOM|nr:hypothetical protein C2G38_2210772 [Gigaspora rosea]